MNKYIDYLKKKHFPITKEIHEEEFLKKKSEMQEVEFNKQYYKKENKDGNALYYEIIAGIPSDMEYTICLLDDILSQQKEILKQQKITARKTSTIAGIVIFWLVCSIISGIYIAVKLGQLFG